MRKYLMLLVIFYSQLAFAIPPSVYDYDIKHWTSADGLSSNSVRAVAQDARGYIWLGSLYGLNRFDGQQFDVFTTDRYPQLASNAITRLLTASDGKLWIGTKAGLSVLDPDTLAIERLPILSEVTSILEVSPGEIWVAADQLYSVVAGKVSQVEQIKSVVSQLVYAEPYLWVSSSTFLYQRDLNGAWQQFALPAELAQMPIYDLAWVDGSLLLASEIGLYRLEQDGQIRQQPLPDQSHVPVYRILQDSTGTIWLSAYRKLFYQAEQSSWQMVTANELGSSPWFSQAFEDKNQHIWLSSYSDGIFRASRSSLRRIVPEGNPVIRTLTLTPQGQLLLASQSELSVMTSDESSTTLVPLTALQDQTIHDLYWYDQNTLWLGGERGLYQYQLGKSTPEIIFPQLQGQAVKAILPAAQDGVWLGTLQGMFYAHDGQLDYPAFNADLESKQITALGQNPRQLVLGTSRGLYRWQAERLTRLGIGSALYNAYVLAIQVLPDDTLLVSTLDDGIFLQLPGQAWLQLHSGNGLLHGPAVSFYFHQQSGWIWVSTLKGIFRIKQASLATAAEQGFRLEEVLSPYERQMGTFSSRCCNGAGQAKVAYWQQQFWYPTLKGVVAVPEKLSHLRLPLLQPVISRLETPHLYVVSALQDRQVLAQDERNLTISYTALEFNRPDSLRFRYQLVGFDDKWHEVAERRQAVYTNLPPGNFVFKVQVKYQHQQWQDAAQTQVQLVIPRRFDETLLYRLLWLLLAICSLYGLFWLYRQNALLKQQQLERVVKQRTAELENSNQRLNELNEQLSQLTHRDSLTGLRNQRFMQEQLPKDVEHFQRNRQTLTQQGKAIALLVLKADNITPILERYGNSTIDALLQHIAALLVRETRGSDYVVRANGNRFVVVFRDIPVAQVAQYSKRLLEQISTSVFCAANGDKIAISVSAGYALYPLPLLGGQLLNWDISMRMAEFALQQLRQQNKHGAVACLAFAERLDAFEFEETVELEQQLNRLMAEELIWLS